MLDTLTTLLYAATMALAAYGVGRPLLRCLRLESHDPLGRAVWGLGLGLVTIGTVLLAMGLARLLYTPLIAIGTLLASFWGLFELLALDGLGESLHPIAIDEAAEDNAAARMPARMSWLLGALVACAAAGSLVSALAPPTAGDALCYHLELPKRYLFEHQLLHLPDHENSTFPLLVEMWYLWALALDDGVTAQVIHWQLGLLLALASVELARPLLGRSWSWLAGALVLLVPGVTNQMTAPLNDVGLAAFTTMALAAWWRGAVTEEHPRWFVVAGVMLGGALGTKYVAILFLLPLVGLHLWWLVKQTHHRRALWRGGVAMALIAASISGTWYLRALWQRGNPVYPFFHEYVASAAKTTLPASKARMGRSPLALVTAPWTITMHPERFGGRGHQLGALFLMVLPVVCCARRLRGLLLMMVFAACYFLLWFLLRQNVRFLLPLLPVLAVILGWGWIEVQRFPPIARRLMTGAALLLLLINAALPWWRARAHLAVVSGWESHEDYLRRHEPTFQAAELANDFYAGRAHLLTQDNNAFYFTGRVTRENVFRRRTKYHQTVASGADLSQVLRSAGFTHLLLAEAESAGGIRYNDTLSRLADQQLAVPGQHSLVCLQDYDIRDQEGNQRRYRLVLLR